MSQMAARPSLQKAKTIDQRVAVAGNFLSRAIVECAKLAAWMEETNRRVENIEGV